jgi:hypothetical protein
MSASVTVLLSSSTRVSAVRPGGEAEESGCAAPGEMVVGTGQVECVARVFGRGCRVAAGLSGPAEVGVLSRVDVERAREFPQRPGRPVRLGEPSILEGDREKQDEEAADPAGGQEHGQLVAGEQLDQEGAGHRRDGQADTQHTGDRAALIDRDLIR